MFRVLGLARRVRPAGDVPTGVGSLQRRACLGTALQVPMERRQKAASGRQRAAFELEAEVHIAHPACPSAFPDEGIAAEREEVPPKRRHAEFAEAARLLEDLVYPYSWVRHPRTEVRPETL